MKRLSAVAAVAAGVVFVFVGTTAAVGGEHVFVGAQKCKMCHKSEAAGAQYQKWADSKHAKAYETLGTEEAKKIAADKGLGDPQKEDACLKCHVTGHGAKPELLGEKYSITEGVSCESCHGAGGDYWKMSVMKDKAAAVAAGLVLPDEKTCKGCHNEESPTYKEFDFKTFAAKIAHPKPKS